MTQFKIGVLTIWSTFRTVNNVNETYVSRHARTLDYN
jgi:hypothetical protein